MRRVRSNGRKPSRPELKQKMTAQDVVNTFLSEMSDQLPPGAPVEQLLTMPTTPLGVLRILEIVGVIAPTDKLEELSTHRSIITQ